MNMIASLPRQREKRPVHENALPFTLFEEIELSGQKDWILKNVIARRETSSWIAPPGKLKSALITELCVHVGAGWDWRGYRSKGRFGCVYFALERGDLVQRRLAAYRRLYGVDALPIAVVGQTLDVMDPGCVETMIATIRAAEEQFEVPVGLVALDTLAKAIAAGGGDEDKAKDQGRALANLRRVQDATDVHVAIIGHTGKDEGRGARGSNAHAGDVDVMVQIKGDDVKVAEIIKANDQAEGVLTRFKGMVHDFGPDEDGDPITTHILDPQLPDDGDENESETPSSPRLPKSAQLALRALQKALAECGEIPAECNHIPPRVPCVTFEQWRQYAYRMGISAGEGRAQQLAFKRASDTLLVSARIGTWEPFVWII